MKLGKHPARKDPRNLRMSSFVDRDKLEAPPFALDRLETISPRSFGAYLNLELGCCVCSTWGSIIEATTAIRAAAGVPGVKRIRIPDAEIRRMYSAIGGYVDSKPETDNGASMTDGANYMRQVGLKDDAGVVHKIFAWVQVDYLNELEMMIAQRYGGLLAVGLALPLSFQDTSKIWDLDGSGAADQVPGSWGGHSAAQGGYNFVQRRYITWGQEQDITNRGAAGTCDEMILGIPDTWVTGQEASPDGFKLDELIAALKSIR